ncbi:MAG: DUF2723 domain-containing protein [bacterium]|nr:DUF2723 domain-containing protein [bacterium]
MTVRDSSSGADDNTSNRWKLVWPIGVGITALTLFTATLAPTVTAEDSGELIAAAWHFGIPHPPGYPLWTLLCGLFVNAVSIGSVAWRANLFSALCSSGAAVLLYGAIRQLRIPRAVAASAALIWVLGRWSWSQSVITEVYGLNSLLTAGVLLCAVRWYATRTDRPLLLASLLMGLGMSNHHIIALAGLALVIWVLCLQPGLVRRWRLVLKCIGLFAVGLLPYLYLPVRAAADPAVNWGDPSTPQRFWEHVTRSQYGAVGPMKTVETRSIPRFGRQLGYAATSVEDDLTAWLAGASFISLIFVGLRDRRVLLLIALWVTCAGGVFALLANYDFDRTSQWAMRVFLIPVSIGPVIALAYMLEAAASRLKQALGPARMLCVACPAALLVAGPTLQVVLHWRQCNYANYWYAEDHARNLLDCMLPQAMVFPSGDHTTFPMVYLQMVEGQRSDVLIADVYGYTTPELYRAQPADAPDSHEAWLIKHARRPVYYTVKKAPPVDNAEFVWAGLVYHLLPDGMAFDDGGLLAACRYRNLDDPSVQDLGSSHILADHAFFSGLDDLRKDRVDAALSYFDAAARHGRGIKEIFNNIGSALAEHGQADQAIGYLEQAASLDARYTLPRWNLFRLARERERWGRARDRMADIIRVDPADYRAHGEMGFLLDGIFGDTAAAIRHWRQSLRLNADQPQIIAALAKQISPDSE